MSSKEKIAVLIICTCFILPTYSLHAQDFNLQNTAPAPTSVTSGSNFNLQNTAPAPAPVTSGSNFNLQNTAPKATPIGSNLPNIGSGKNYSSDLGGVVALLGDTLSALVPLIIGFALLAFLWGVFMYLWQGDDESKREESKKFMIWGIVGLTVMVSLWGLVSITANSLNFHLPSGLVPTLPDKEK